MVSKKRIRSIACLMSVCLLMIGVPVHAENTDLDVETVQEEATVDIEEVQNEGLPSDGETEQNAHASHHHRHAN